MIQSLAVRLEWRCSSKAEIYPAGLSKLGQELQTFVAF